MDQNTFTDSLLALITVVISIVLLNQYRKKKITIIQLLIWSFSFQAYSIIQIGATITPFFIITFLLSVHKTLFRFKDYILRKYSFKFYLLIILPFISSIFSFILYFSGNSNLVNPKSDLYFLVRPLVFYFKNFIPLFIISKVILDSATDYKEILVEIKRIAIFSCYFSLVQITVYAISHDIFILELLGGKKRYLTQLPNGIEFIRVNALFIEPKNLGAFLGLALPLFWKDKNYLKMIVAVIIGLLTISQTFILFLLISIVVFGLVNRLKNLRSKVLTSISVIFLFFYSISLLKQWIVDNTLDNRESIAFEIILKRALNRYDTNFEQDEAEFLGMPIQKDLEYPVVQFMKDFPYLLFTGYGIGNSNFIPPQYFYGQWNYDLHLEGIHANHMNLRWYFYISEFGILIFIYFFIFFTKIKGKTYGHKYYSFILVTLFFSEMELFLIIFYQHLTKPN
jgi:hypothetical protein